MTCCLSDLQTMSGGGLTEQSGIQGASLRPYLKRKKSSFVETKVAVIGPHGVGKSGKYTFIVSNIKNPTYSNVQLLDLVLKYRAQTCRKLP